MLARRGAPGRARGCCPTGRTRPGWLRCTRAGGRRQSTEAPRDAAGPRRRRHRRDRRPAGARARGRGRARGTRGGAGRRGRRTVSGVDVDTGELGGPARAGRRHGHLRHPQGRAARRPGGVRTPASVHLVPLHIRRARPPRRGRREPPGRRRGGAAAARPTSTRTSTRAASSASERARRPTPAPACSASRGRRPGCAAWSATSPAPATRWSRPIPTWSPRTAGCRRGPSARAADPTSPTMLGRGAARRRPDRGRRRRAGAGRRPADRARRAHPARRRARRG